MLVALGLSALLAASVTAFTVLKVVGALYLLWLAVQAVRHGSALNIDATKPLAPIEPLYRTWLMGLGVNLLNPKIIMFFVTFLPQFVTAGDPHAAQKLIFLGIVFVAVALPITIAMIVSAARLASLLKRTPRVMRTIDWLFAEFFPPSRCASSSRAATRRGGTLSQRERVLPKATGEGLRRVPSAPTTTAASPHPAASRPPLPSGRTRRVARRPPSDTLLRSRAAVEGAHF